MLIGGQADREEGSVKARQIVAVIMIAVGVLAAQASSADAGVRSPAAMYWGAVIKGETYGIPGDAPWNRTVWNMFEKHAGKKVTVVNFAQPWGSFDATPFQALRNRGALPFVQMGLQGTTLADVAAGNQDAVIRAWAQKAKAWGYPFLFGPWWEMNGGWYAWGRSPDFVAAWRRFHDIVVSEGATNVTWDWVVNGIWWDPASDPAPYYPGDDYVDWVGIDSYNWGENPLKPDRWETPAEVVDPTLDRLAEIAPGKPVCVCETAATEIGGDKAGWIRDFLRSYLPQRPEIKAFLWFNWNIQEPTKPGRWDWPIESSPTAQQSFRRWIQSPRYLSTLPALTPLEKVPLP
jgi:hypothetical protein